jgi:SAM-dependent methyltransferase
MRTDYASHDPIYQRYKAQGAVGWDQTEAAYREREVQLDRILSCGRAPTSGRLFELGCGAGNISIWLAKRGYEVCGVDISPTAIQWAEENARAANSTARFLVGDVCELAGFDEGSFDGVLDGHCFHCIIGSDRPRFLATAFRLLRPGGYLLVDTMCGPEVDPEVFKGYDPQSRCTLCGDLATRYFGLPDDIHAEVQQAGFQILHTAILPEEANSNMIIEARRS